MFGISKGWAGTYIVAVFGAAAILSLGLGLLANKTTSAGSACTMEAKQCPDGSYVGRTGPNCEFAACPASAAIGTLKGKVSIGPLCPVEPCHSATSPYSGKVIEITYANGNKKTADLRGDGSFQATLVAGEYTISMSNCKYLGCSRVFPKKVSISAGKTSEVTIDIDTGIR